MNSDTLLFRQVHPSWIQAGGVTSQAFKPTRKDDNRLSVYDGELIDAEASWHHYTTDLGGKSVGVLAVTVFECSRRDLDVVPDPDEFLEHMLIDFTGKTRSQVEKAATYLRDLAIERGWQHRAQESR